MLIKTIFKKQRKHWQFGKKIETSKDSNLKNMTEALIDDIARSKVDIIDETDDYFIIKVKKGDTLSHLAKRYYKDSSKFKIIYEANMIN